MSRARYFVGTLSVIFVFLLVLCGGITSPIWIQEFREARLYRRLHDRVYAERLRADCRQLIANTPKNADRNFVSVPESAYPSSIQMIAPCWVLVSRERVHIELGNGFHHFGVDCFPAGVQGSGDKEMVKGLWYVSGEK